MAWLAGWGFRKTVTITGQAGAGINYQVDFSIAESAGGDFNLESHCTSFPNDIQVTDNDQTTPLDYFVEDLTVDPIKMWVEVADDLGSNADICVYYGKSGASTESNIANTFLVGDDFPGSSLDTTKWNSGGGGTLSISGSIITLTSTAGGYKYLSSKTTFGVNTAFRARLKSDTYTVATTWGYSLSDNAVRFHADWSDWNQYVTETYISSYEANAIGTGYTGYRIWDIYRNSTTNVIFKIGGSTVATHTTIIPTIATGAALFAYTNGAIIYCDWMLVRKYNSSEPAYLSASAEESEGIGRLVYGGLVNDGLIGGRLVA